MDEFYPPDIGNLSATLTQTLNIQPGQAGQPNLPNQPDQPSQEPKSKGKRSQKDANLESGSLTIAYQQAKTEETHAKPNLSRQQSSLNTPTVSEQLTSSSSMSMNAANVAGGEYNRF